MSQNSEFTLFYDGECPFCKREVSWLQGMKKAGLITFIDIASGEFKPSEYGLSQEEFMAEIRGLRANGELVTGMEVFRELYTLLGFGFLVSLSRLPIVKQLMDIGYKCFAKIRVPLGNLFRRDCESGTCKR